MSDIALAASLAITILIARLELAAGSSSDMSSRSLFRTGSRSSGRLTFLAGAEVDVSQFRREWRASLSIGAVLFAAPFLVATGFG